MLDIGEKLRAARMDQNMSLRELAEKAEVSASLLSQIENGKANPSVRSLYSIAAALSLSVDYFFPDNGDQAAEIADLSSTLSEMTPSQLRATQDQGLFDETDFFADQQPPRSKGPVVCKNKRATIELMGGVIWQRLTPSSEENIEFIEISYAVGATSGRAMSHHVGREYGLILEGELTVELGFERYLLQPGDSIAFDSTMPHRMINSGAVPVRAIWVVLDRVQSGF
ncbi:MAG: cupin domain-containing protein [Chloroflexi bacterium]|nr:cupin domain-containing protein [Chloroflexota bacterium]